MRDHGPDLQLGAHCSRCGTWPRIDLNDYARGYGWDFTFWDWEEPCDGCGDPLTFLCSPGPTTPMLPMRTRKGEARLLRAAADREAARLRAMGWEKVDGRWVKPVRGR